MPTWNFVLSAGVLSREEKDTIASKITKIYTNAGLPAFYVHIYFDEYPSGSYYNGAETPTMTVLLTIGHVAGHFASEKESLSFHDKVDAVLRPSLEPKGLVWEYNVLLPSQANWRINGIIPPTTNDNERLQQWAEKNAPISL